MIINTIFPKINITQDLLLSEKQQTSLKYTTQLFNSKMNAKRLVDRTGFRPDVNLHEHMIEPLTPA